MGAPLPPTALTITLNGAERTFHGGTVTIGRALDSGVVVDHPLVSRLHASVTWHGRWVLADRGSTNGVFFGGQRLTQPLPVTGPVQVRLGDPGTGPLLSLVPQAPPAPPPPPRPQPPRQHQPFPGQQPPSNQFPGQQPPSQPFAEHGLTRAAGPGQQPPVRAQNPAAPASTPMGVPAGGLGIGRTPENGIVVADVLVSRRHARLFPSPQGLMIEDLGSANGTFVNGRREQRTLLRESDIVTVGNSDFVVTGGMLRPRPRPTAAAGLGVHGLGFAVEGKQLLVDVNLSASPGTLTALIGPSGAGKSTLAKVVAGTNPPTRGAVMFQGHNLHADYAALRSRIGMVPQDDVLHRQLTVRQALGFAAELRLPPDTTPDAREQVIRSVLAELSLTEHAETRVDRLSGGQRKRASVAMELLTGPTLLILDEPTSGLDPALDRQVMVMLRQLADAGRVVIVVTHSLTHLDMCDQILLLAPGGKTAYRGHPGGVGAAMGSTDWAEIFTVAAANPDGVFAAHRQREPAQTEPPPPARYSGPGQPAHTSGGKQVSTLVRRQLRLILADRGYLGFLAVMPFVLGLLSLVVPGKAGFGPPGLDAPTEAAQLLVLLILGACLMGASLSVRDLVGERPIFQREKAAGLLPSAYLTAKIVVFGMASAVQSAILVAIVVAGKGAPTEGALLPSGSLELFIAIALTSGCCVMVGLLLSSVARSNEQVMPLLVVIIMAQLVMCGGLILVTGRTGLEQASWLFPARWGFAAGASTVDLNAIRAASAPPGTTSVADGLWEHDGATWVLNCVVLSALGAVFAALTMTRLKGKK